MGLQTTVSWQEFHGGLTPGRDGVRHFWYRVVMHVKLERTVRDNKVIIVSAVVLVVVEFHCNLGFVVTFDLPCRDLLALE